MEAAVSTVLAGNQLTAWDAFGDWCSFPGFKPSRRTVPQAAGAPPQQAESLAAAGGKFHGFCGWNLS